MKNLEKTYNPKDFEKKIYNSWLEDKDFVAEVNPIRRHILLLCRLQM